MAEIFRAKEPFACADADGVPRVVSAGDLVSADDPIFKGRRQFFEPVEVAAARSAGVEDATAEPGSLRSMHPAKKAPAKKVAPHPTPATDPKGD